MRRRVFAGFAAALAAVSASAAGCSIVHRAVSPPAPATSTAPSLSSVAKARYVSTVDVDGGQLEVDPPNATTGISPSRAEAMFRAADVVEGDRGFAIFGLGVATVAASGTPATTTTTAPASTTTTGGAVTAPGAPAYDHRLAWVGIVWDAGASCATTSTTRPGSPHTSKYVAVLLDARTGRDALAYSSAAAACGSGSGRPTPTLGRPVELVSVPWQPVASASTAVHATLPACSQYAGWTQVSDPGGTATAVEVVARVPYDPGCGSTSTHDVVVDDVVPLGSTAQAQLPHAAVGPVDALHTLATS